jgi:L-threonylcarbamoyladenylate synthase
MSNADARLTTDTARAARVLRDGGLIGLPTETVYGLGADACNAQAVTRIFSAKQRPADHPLIVHIHQPAQMRQWARDVPPAAWQLAEAFWPGPLTLVLPRAPGVLDVVTGGLDTVALRVPSHPLALDLLAKFGGGVAAPSANRHGRVSPTMAQHVRSELGDAVDLLLDGGPCRVGIESTIVDFVDEGVRILRPGCITAQDLRRVTGRNVFDRADPAVRRPGAMTSHYAPRATVLLTSAEDAPAALETWHRNGARAGLLSAYRPEHLPAGVPWLSLGAASELQARQLYALLRRADDLGLDVLVAVPPTDEGLGAALCDRLVRAAGLGDGRAFAGRSPPVGRTRRASRKL